MCVGISDNIALCDPNDDDYYSEDDDADAECSCPLEEPFTTIVAVGNTSLKGMEYNEARELLLAEGEKELCVRHSKFDWIFLTRL